MGSDANQRASVTAHLDFLARILAVAGADDLRDACTRIQDGLADRGTDQDQAGRRIVRSMTD